MGGGRTDLVATFARAFVLYSLAEFQAGGATTIRVTRCEPVAADWDQLLNLCSCPLSGRPRMFQPAIVQRSQKQPV